MQIWYGSGSLPQIAWLGKRKLQSPMGCSEGPGLPHAYITYAHIQLTRTKSQVPNLMESTRKPENAVFMCSLEEKTVINIQRYLCLTLISSFKLLFLSGVCNLLRETYSSLLIFFFFFASLQYMASTQWMFVKWLTDSLTEWMSDLRMNEWLIVWSHLLMVKTRTQYHKYSYWETFPHGSFTFLYILQVSHWLPFVLDYLKDIHLTISLIR